MSSTPNPSLISMYWLWSWSWHHGFQEQNAMSWYSILMLRGVLLSSVWMLAIRWGNGKSICVTETRSPSMCGIRCSLVSLIRVKRIRQECIHCLRAWINDVTDWLEEPPFPSQSPLGQLGQWGCNLVPKARIAELTNNFLQNPYGSKDWKTPVLEQPLF